ncbi:hypothetical protein [Streptomyces sp. JJ36]|uniref:hypothetical protein n=1 Tax=Streptomyces sp. JJ36 TaxID=2736645 RepID=UPI001F37BD90|nr:hypothetical protein [Streptomyces sp. JJ36]MCF6524899.1 hypothetical protein [Streptomyces sp. JJ36]
MPLTFLTADREADTFPASETPLPFEQRDHWRRPYRPGPWRVGGAALLLLLTAYLLISAVIIAMAGASSGALSCAAAAAVMVATALRLLRMGVWVSGRGLRHTGLLRTVTFRWERVAGVRTAQQPVRWLGLPRTVQGQALVLVRGRGGGEPRVLLTDRNADFLGRREAFDRAADVIESWADEARSLGRSG